MQEAEEDEFRRSELDFTPKLKLKPEEQKEVDMTDYSFMNEDADEEDWDGDTYDATAAVHGTPAERAYERSKTNVLPQGNPNLKPRGTMLEVHNLLPIQ